MTFVGGKNIAALEMAKAFNIRFNDVASKINNNGLVANWELDFIMV